MSSGVNICDAAVIKSSVKQQQVSVGQEEEEERKAFYTKSCSQSASVVLADRVDRALHLLQLHSGSDCSAR